MRTLLSTIAMPISPLQRGRLELIDNEDFGPVTRKTREELEKQAVSLSVEEADAGILALKQYYAVALLDPLNEHAVSDVIDPYWHAHILHTRQYTEFCEKVLGQYMHHDPLDHADTAKVAYVARLYRYTVSVYGQMFNHVDERFYPSNQPDSRLICMHFGNTNPVLCADARFPAVNFSALPINASL
ncbi:MAG: hypothetical protein KW802_04190 [Candidatus Doudnabacteria bacterium]|nr:hypothetical protein [Candidatus Doudnabacteria bacterium]